MGRILFLWFLQAKRWLGYDGTGVGPHDYLLRLWNGHEEAFFRTRLAPLFFEALGKSQNDRTRNAPREIFGEVPYLNGGLFRTNPLEERLGMPDEIPHLPDEVFDPQGTNTVF